MTLLLKFTLILLLLGVDSLIASETTLPNELNYSNDAYNLSQIDNVVVNTMHNKYMQYCHQFLDEEDFSPSKRINHMLNGFVNLGLKSSLDKYETNLIIKRFKYNGCLGIFRSVSMKSEKTMENTLFNDYDKYYSKNSINLDIVDNINSTISNIKSVITGIDGFKFPYFDNYVYLVLNEISMLNYLDSKYFSAKEYKSFSNIKIPNLSNYKAIFVGAGFPFSPILVNIYTHAKVEIVDVDEDAIKNAKKVINHLSSLKLINKDDFTFLNINGKDLDLNKKSNKTLLYLGSSLPNNVKSIILKKVTDEQTFVIDRYVEGIYKVYYHESVPVEKLPGLRVIAEVHPYNIFNNLSEKKDRYVLINHNNNLNSARLLVMNET